jgi:hypothetical protein
MSADSIGPTCPGIFGEAWELLPVFLRTLTTFFLRVNSYNLLIAILALSTATVVTKSLDYIKIQSMLIAHLDIASSPQF